MAFSFVLGPRASARKSVRLRADSQRDRDAQKDFVDELCAFAQSRKVHVHLVHHIRKGDNEDQVPGKFDAKGAAVHGRESARGLRAAVFY